MWRRHPGCVSKHAQQAWRERGRRCVSAPHVCCRRYAGCDQTVGAAIGTQGPRYCAGAPRCQVLRACRRLAVYKTLLGWSDGGGGGGGGAGAVPQEGASPAANAAARAGRISARSATRRTYAEPSTQPLARLPLSYHISAAYKAAAPAGCRLAWQTQQVEKPRRRHMSQRCAPLQACMQAPACKHLRRCGDAGWARARCTPLSASQSPAQQPWA